MATIKINREQLIKTLTAKVKEMEQQRKDYEAAGAALRKERAAWETKIIALAAKNYKKYQHGSFQHPWNNSIKVEINVPTEDCPPEPHMPEGMYPACSIEIKELKQFIRMLEMGTDESVSMTSLKSIAQYL
jgi:hypothetical protein